MWFFNSLVVSLKFLKTLGTRGDYYPKTFNFRKWGEREWGSHLRSSGFGLTFLIIQGAAEGQGRALSREPEDHPDPDLQLQR